MTEATDFWKKSRARALLTALALTAGLVLAADHHLLAGEDASKKGPELNLSLDNSPVAREGKSITSFSPVVKKVAPCVATITTTTQPRRPQGRFRVPNDPLFRRFFGEDFGGGENMVPRKQYGLGSGVIVTKDGYILTNNHVVEGADKIEITLADGREFTAKLVGADKASDVAVLKIKAADLPFATMADSDKIETGDIVLAVGNPFGIGQTVTMGMVSATRRSGMADGMAYQDFIQTDAAINPGNSGGALVDAVGRLVGVNTMILSNGGGGNQGIGFAIPSNLARRVMVSLVRDGRVVRGHLGVWFQDVSPALATEFKLGENRGALVTDVEPKGPADKAGIKSGDVILAFNGEKVRDGNHLRLAVSESAPGVKSSVEVFRDGKTKNFEVTLSELRAKTAAGETSEPEEKSNTDTLNGVTVADLDGPTHSELRIPSSVQGVVVTEVAQDSTSYDAGLRAGDVIVEINHKPVRSADEAVAMTTKAKDAHSLLRIWRRDTESGSGGYRFIAVDESKTN